MPDMEMEMEELEELEEEQTSSPEEEAPRSPQWRDRLNPQNWSENCYLTICITLCFLFIISVFTALAAICMDIACRDNPCNPYCPRGYGVDPNGTNPCDLWKQDQEITHSKRWTHDDSHLCDLTQDHDHPWMNNAWYRYVYDRTHTFQTTYTHLT